MLLIKLKKCTITVGKIFLKKERISEVFFSFSIALLLVFLFSITLLSKHAIILEIGIYAVNLSLLFFFYALYKFYRIFKP